MSRAAGTATFDEFRAARRRRRAAEDGEESADATRGDSAGEAPAPAPAPAPAAGSEGSRGAGKGRVAREERSAPLLLQLLSMPAYRWALMLLAVLHGPATHWLASSGRTGNSDGVADVFIAAGFVLTALDFALRAAVRRLSFWASVDLALCFVLLAGRVFNPSFFTLSLVGLLCTLRVVRVVDLVAQEAAEWEERVAEAEEATTLELERVQRLRLQVEEATAKWRGEAAARERLEAALEAHMAEAETLREALFIAADQQASELGFEGVEDEEEVARMVDLIADSGRAARKGAGAAAAVSVAAGSRGGAGGGSGGGGGSAKAGSGASTRSHGSSGGRSSGATDSRSRFVIGADGGVSRR